MNATIKHGLLLASVVAGLGVFGAGCLTRPIASSEPETKTNFSNVVTNQAIDKVDLLFDIDNSASMGDKQTYLFNAIPDLINRLVNPNCVDPTSGAYVANSTGGTCPQNSTLEFPPVHDMHLGIVTSSLGTRLGDTIGPVCVPNAMPLAPYNTISAHNDDQGHLVSRSLNITATPASEGAVANATVAAYTPAPGGFLYWFPGMNPAATTPTPETSTTQLIADFGAMVQGVGIWGCGIESQLESWYRFLVQPDPYGSLALDANGHAEWQDVDTMILKQRKDFLRPDSLVAVIVLSDENDSEIDVRSLGQVGYYFMGTQYQPSRGTAACAQNPNATGCGSCSVGANAGDANCKNGAYTASNDWGFDINLRHVHMKAKYGVDPQYPIQRYAIGLTSATVPDRNGEYPPGALDYTGSPALCTNPLFAASLPDGTATDNKSLCNLPPGTRTKDHIFYAVIGGVPHELLHFDPNNLDNSRLTDADWVRILGTGWAGLTLSSPATYNPYNYNGIDPHMIEDYRDRAGVIAANGYGFTIDTSATNALQASTTAPAATDPVNGREWVTDQEMTMGVHVLAVDRQYACIFKVPARDCTLAQNSNACDCPSKPGLSAAQTPPLCDPNTPTSQIAAKAYPTIRELTVARLMGNQGIVASLCPIDVTDNTMMNDPLYGYRPAVAVIIDRLKNALNNQCLPEQLSVDPTDGTVPCLILVTMPTPATPNGGTCLNPVCDPGAGVITPTNHDVLVSFCASQETAYKAAGGTPGAIGDPALQSVCELKELTPMANAADFDTTGSCQASGDPGWCYVQGPGAKGCPQAIVFPKGSPPAGAVASLQCIEQSCKNKGQPCGTTADCCSVTPALNCVNGTCE